MNEPVRVPSREQLIHTLYEAAELEHNLMCTYLYAAFSLREGTGEGLSEAEAEAVARWRRAIVKVAIEEMGHLTAVWNITSALGGTPRFGRANFPLDPGILPANVVVKLAPFDADVLQHFIFLERPEGSSEPDGNGFVPEAEFTKRGTTLPRITPMPLDYETVGTFYAELSAGLQAFAAKVGEKVAFCGDSALQLSPSEITLGGAKPVLCLKTAIAGFTAIIEQGEGARQDSMGSHYHVFRAIREELEALKAKNPTFVPAFPAAHNPVLRPPIRRQGRVWLEDEEAAATVDLANTGYGLMLRLLAYSYVVPRPAPEKGLAIDLGLGLMRAVTHLADHAARLPAGPSNPQCNAGMSFTALRDAAPFAPGASSWQFFTERFAEMAAAAEGLAKSEKPRLVKAARFIADLERRAHRGVAMTAPPAPVASAPDGAPVAAAPAAPAVAPVAVAPAAPTNGAPAVAKKKTLPLVPPTPVTVDGVDSIEGDALTLVYEGKRCIHARFCVTWAPGVFIANVQGPWIQPDAVTTEALVEIAHVCPSGAIRYKRKDGGPEEEPAAVNLLAVREGGPYAVRGDIRLDGVGGIYRATLCRCGASKNKPYCDGSHHEVGFAATGEPPSGKTDMLKVRNGALAIDPQLDGPLQVRGNLEITSGTGRVVARVEQARLCRCGGSNTKPFCDGTHERIGFRSA